uniref:Blastula protease 10-like n=1 Tax=Actinia tenebrosa TaxID=6105 RepID=A0A6P8INL6_ACTTE
MFLTSFIIFVVLQNTVLASNCRQVIPIDGLFPNGSFTSPGWPNPYQPNKNCTWTISSLPGTYIKLTVTHFDLQDDIHCSDKVLIRPGNEAGVKLCAHNRDLPFVAYSSNNHFDVHFIADGTTVSQSTGFKAEYVVLQASCPPSNLDGLSGRIVSPNFPDYYPSTMCCEYNITVPLGYQVELNFSTFDLEDSYDCTNDYVTVDDLSNQHSIWVLCGVLRSDGNMLSYRSRGRSMLVTFVSDDDVIANGFEAKFTAMQETLSFSITSSYVSPTNMVFTHTTTSMFSSKSHEITKSTFELVAPSKTSTCKPVMTPSPTVALRETEFLGGTYRSIPNHTIKGHSIRKLSTSSQIACVLLCQQSSKCKSVTYLYVSQSSGLCTLHKTNIRETPGSIVAESHVIYYELIT